MICINCDCEEFVPGKTNVKQHYKDQTFFVFTDVMFCKECGWFTVTTEQADKLVERTKEAWQKFVDNSANPDINKA